MPITLIHDSGYCHGIPKDGVPVIPGFRVIARTGHWLMAERRHKTYIVRETPTHWIMERYGPDLWSRHAARHRRHTHKEAVARHSWLLSAQAWTRSPIRRKGYAGERHKGVWALDTSEAVAVRKSQT